MSRRRDRIAILLSAAVTLALILWPPFGYHWYSRALQAFGVAVLALMALFYDDG
jgi:hypothetical protein